MKVVTERFLKEITRDDPRYPNKVHYHAGMLLAERLVQLTDARGEQVINRFDTEEVTEILDDLISAAIAMTVVDRSGAIVEEVQEVNSGWGR